MRPALLGVLLVMLVPAAAGAAEGPIRLGAVFSATGPAAAYGAQQVQGARLAVAEINRDRLLGRRLNLAVRDDGSTADGATQAFAGLIEDGVVALLGPTLSTAALEADRLAQERGVPVLGVSNTVDGITEIGRWVFRNSLAERVVQPRTIAVTARRLGYTRAAIVWTTPDAYAQAGHDVFLAALATAGVDVVADVSFASADPEAHRAAVDQVAAAAPDALIISALAPDVARVAQYARGLPALAGVPFIGGNAFNTPGLLASSGGAMEGAISGSAWLASRRTPGNRAFVAAFRKRFGAEPDQFAAQAYAGVHLIARAIRDRRAATYSAIRRGLAALRDVPTVLGRFSFTAGREPRYDPVVVRLTDDGFVAF